MRAITHSGKAWEAEALAMNAGERRMTWRLHNYWRVLRGGRTYPSLDDFNVEAVPGFAPHCFLLDLTGGVETPVFRFVGPALSADCGMNFAQEPLSAVPHLSLLARVTDHYSEVIDKKAPVSFETEYVDAQGVGMLCRGVMVPFSGDGETIDHIVGAIRSKVKPLKTALTSPRPGKPESAPVSPSRRRERASLTQLVGPVLGALIDMTRRRLENVAAASRTVRNNGTLKTVRGFFRARFGKIKGCVMVGRTMRRAADSSGRRNALDQAKAVLRRTPAIGRVSDGASGEAEFVVMLGRRTANEPDTVQVLRVLDEKASKVDVIVKHTANELAEESEVAAGDGGP